MNLFERNLRLIVLFSFFLFFDDQRFHRIRKTLKIFTHVDRSQRIVLIDKTQSEKNDRSRRERPVPFWRRLRTPGSMFDRSRRRILEPIIWNIYTNESFVEQSDEKRKVVHLMRMTFDWVVVWSLRTLSSINGRPAKEIDEKGRRKRRRDVHTEIGVRCFGKNRLEENRKGREMKLIVHLKLIQSKMKTKNRARTRNTNPESIQWLSLHLHASSFLLLFILIEQFRPTLTDESDRLKSPQKRLSLFSRLLSDLWRIQLMLFFVFLKILLIFVFDLSIEISFDRSKMKLFSFDPNLSRRIDGDVDQILSIVIINDRQRQMTKGQLDVIFDGIIQTRRDLNDIHQTGKFEKRLNTLSRSSQSVIDHWRRQSRVVNHSIRWNNRSSLQQSSLRFHTSTKSRHSNKHLSLWLFSFTFNSIVWECSVLEMTSCCSFQGSDQEE